MGKKGGSFWDNPFGGLFDMNRDGKESFLEQVFGLKILEELEKEEQSRWEEDSEESIFGDSEQTEDDWRYAWRKTCEDGWSYGIEPEEYETEEEYDEALEEAKYGWRETCEDSSDYGVDPEDYETEIDYNAALLDAKYGWQENCEDGSEYGLDPEDYDTEEEYLEALEEAKEVAQEDEQEEDQDDEESSGITLHISFSCSTDDEEEISESDYPNKRRYNAAYALATKLYPAEGSEYDKQCLAACRFIDEKADEIIAANYLSHKAGFLYSQAVQDHFDLDFSLPEEDENQEYDFWQVISKTAKRDIPLSFRVWEWCLDTFSPYVQYDSSAPYDLTNAVWYRLYDFPEDYCNQITRYMEKNASFAEKIMEVTEKLSRDLSDVVAAAIQNGSLKTAEFLFRKGIGKANGDWKNMNAFTQNTIERCEHGEEVESMEFFRDHLFPVVQAVDIGMVKDELKGWSQEISQYIERTEQTSEKYAYTRRNAWRKNAPDGSQFHLNPCSFRSEEAYRKALSEAKYSWRKFYLSKDNCGLNPNDFETAEEFRSAITAKREEQRKQRIKQQSAERDSDGQISIQEVYTYCGVLLPFSTRPYAYRTEDPTIQIGDKVYAPVGDDPNGMIGTVVSVGKYAKIAVPYPVERTKFILGKVPEGE